jgi:hypothetical protein
MDDFDSAPILFRVDENKLKLGAGSPGGHDITSLLHNYLALISWKTFLLKTAVSLAANCILILICFPL